MRWPYYKHIFFDCDSTLTTVEGIDILADTEEKRREVESLTMAAMDGQLGLEEVYDRRLQTINPTHDQIREIRRVYKKNTVADAAAVIAALHELNLNVYIISGGLAEPVEEFGIFLGVPRQRIRAVNVSYNQLDGTWWQHNNDDAHYLAYQKGSLTISDGKAQIVRELLAGQHGSSLLIGDGSSDLLAGTAVDLFVGFGGVVTRERVLAEAPVFIHSPSLAPLLPLAAGPAALNRLQNQELAQKASQIIKNGGITFQNEQLKQKFHKAYQAVYSRPNGS